MNTSMKGQYVVYRTGAEGKSTSWGLVDAETDTQAQGINEKSLPYKDGEQFSVHKRDVIALLGKRPHFGTSYGCRIEPFHRTVESEAWGSLHFFMKMEEEDKGHLKTGLSKVHQKLKKAGLTGFLPLDIELRNAKGKYAGSYASTTKPGVRDRMTLHPKDWSDSLYIVAHESGHGVWYCLMGPKARAQWVTLYHSYLAVTECDAQTVKGLRDDFCGQALEHVRDFKGQLAEEVAPVFDLCIEHITTYHGISVTNIDNLIEAEHGKFLKTLWPSARVLKTDYEYPVSEYAATKPEEFFAEAFAFWLRGTKLPKKVQSLMDTTLQRCAGRKSLKANAP